MAEALAHHSELKKRALEDSRRSGGRFGQETLLELRNREESSESESELNFMNEILNGPELSKQQLTISDIQDVLIAEKKRRLLDELS